jgi:hypothetical protein
VALHDHVSWLKLTAHRFTPLSTSGKIPCRTSQGSNRGCQIPAVGGSEHAALTLRTAGLTHGNFKHSLVWAKHPSPAVSKQSAMAARLLGGAFVVVRSSC